MNPHTGKPVDMLKERVELLIRVLEKTREKIIIPTPALSEILVLGKDRAADYLAELNSTYRFEVAPFDQVAAVEAALFTSGAMTRGSKRGSSKANWEKVKFDRQIVAIAKTRGATAIYSNDEDVRKFGDIENIEVIAAWELPVPPVQQMPLDYTKPTEKGGVVIPIAATPKESGES